MNYHANIDESHSVPGNGATGYPIITGENACVDGLLTGVGVFFLHDYPPAGIHDDHEGFYVIHGSGFAKVGESEFRISSGTSFVAPAGVPHAIKKDKDSGELRIFWFHFPR